uniref:Receptor tyrosine kinase n=1 Tax=Suberites domuncula TaxID=55567 RepID=Q5K4G5_SUBDO|nr:receptor tyrosine kinase [Suberites domuncula]
MLTNRAQKTRQDFVQLQCGSNRRHDKNSIVWTKLTADQIVEVSSGNSSIRVPIPDVDTKFLCHDRSKSEVHNIYYISPHNNEEIVYPPPTMEPVHINYTLENVIERDGIINLCLIQPYSRQNTVSSVTFKRGSTVLRANASRSIELISGRSAGVSATLMSKLIGETHTGIVYFMQIRNVSEVDTSLEFVRWLEGGRFSCSLNRPRNRVKVSFRLNLTTGHNAMESLGMPTSLFCPIREVNMIPTLSLIRSPTTISQDAVPVTDSTFGLSTTALTGNPFLVGRASQRWDQQTIKILLSTLSIVAIVIVIIAFIGGILCTKRVAKYRGRKVQKMSTQVVTFGRCQRISMSSDSHHSDSTTSDPLGDNGCITMSRKLAVADGVFVPFHLLNLKDDLGSGAFGVVKKAELFDPISQTTSIVAVKMLKESASTEDEKDIIMELKVLYHVGEHCNVVSFLGASVHKGKLHLIVEYCERGNLLQFLRSKRGDMKSPLSVQNQVAIASQVANGMAYLASKRCIHRDLAARNVLITKDLTLKVADFGLARKMYSSVYRPSGKRLPIKWMAPEGILDGVCTSKSDVWSFGILLWEIMTLGRTPYPGRSAHWVIRDIENGYRMPQPDGCPDKLYSVMKCCWQMNPIARPEFTELTNSLDNVVMELDSGQLHKCYYNLEDTTSIEGCSTDVSYRSRSPSQSSLISHMYCSYCQPVSNHTSLNRTSPP